MIATVLAGTADAKTNPAVACAAFKLKSVGSLASALLLCHAKAAQSGAPVDQKCLDVPREKFAAAFAKAEAAARKGGASCPVEGDAAETRSTTDAQVAAIVSALRPASSPSKCAAKKINAVGKHILQQLGTRAKNLIKPDSDKLAVAVEKSGTALATVFSKADAKGSDCQTSQDATALATSAATLVGTEVCDDDNRCTIDSIVGVETCRQTPVACGAFEACDYRTGDCELANCCLMSLGATTCVVPIPINQVPTSQAFCTGVVTAKPTLTLISVGPSCIGWRATGSNDCQ